MTSRLRNSILLLGGAVGLFTGFYTYARPNWRLLSESELRATLKPELLQVDPIDPAAQGRYRRFQGIVAELGYGEHSSNDAVRNTQLRIRRQSPEIQALERLVFEGPFQNPERAYVPRRFEPMYLTMQLGECFAVVARSEIDAGDGASAARHYRTAIGIAEQMAHMAGNWAGLSYQSRLYESIEQKLFKPPVGLTESELGEIARAIPPSPLKDSDSRRLVLRDCQMIYPALVDPIGWTRKAMPEEKDPERMLARVAAGAFLGPDTEAVLTYDARDTAEHLNHIVPIALANAGRSFHDQDLGLTKYGSRLTAAYPANGASGKAGAELWFRRMEYRWATARVRNGLGNRVIEMMCESLETMPPEASFFRRALRESIRTRIALQRYRLRYGHPAPDLASLTKTGLLTGLPLDPYDGSSLHYDPKRRLLWSVGENGRDDRGRGRNFGDRGELDIVWKTL